MTDLERLLHHTMELTLALNKATAALVNAATHLAAASETIQRQQGEIECLQLDLAEARAGRSVRQ